MKLLTKNNLLVIVVCLFTCLYLSPTNVISAVKQPPQGRVVIINASDNSVVFYLRWKPERPDSEVTTPWTRFQLAGGGQDLYRRANQIRIITYSHGDITKDLRDARRYKIIRTSAGALNVVEAGPE